VIAKGGVYSGYFVYYPESSLLSLRLYVSIASDKSYALFYFYLRPDYHLPQSIHPYPISISNWCRPLSSLYYSIHFVFLYNHLLSQLTLVEQNRQQRESYTHFIYLSELGTAGLPLDSSRICFILIYHIFIDMAI
jgi:hypothetical protein